MKAWYWNDKASKYFTACCHDDEKCSEKFFEKTIMWWLRECNDGIMIVVTEIASTSWVTDKALLRCQRFTSWMPLFSNYTLSTFFTFTFPFPHLFCICLHQKYMFSAYMINLQNVQDTNTQYIQTQKDHIHSLWKPFCKTLQLMNSFAVNLFVCLFFQGGV